jgi:hypothetical protein
LEARADVIACARCGAENPASAKFCARCWGLLHGPTCPHCGKRATRAGARYCEHCGDDLYAARSPAAPIPQESLPPASPAGEPLAAPQIEKPVQITEYAPAAPPPTVPAEPAVAVSREELSPAAEAPEQAVVREKPALREAMVLPEQPSAPSRPPQPPRRLGPLLALGLLAAAVVAVAFSGGLVIRRHQTGIGNSVTAPSPRGQSTTQEQPAAAPSPSEVSPSEAPKPPAPASGGTLRITTVPSDARVELDGTPVGVTDLTLSDVKPGRHTVKIGKPGFRAVIRELEVAAGDTVNINLTLAAVPPAPVQRRRAPPAPPLPPPPPPPPP